MSRRRFPPAVLLVLAACAAANGFAQDSQPVRVLPQAPAAGEDFVIQVTVATPSTPATHVRTIATLEGGTILLRSEHSLGDFSAVDAYRAGAVVNVPSPGTYAIDVQPVATGPGAVSFARRNVGTVTVGPAIAASVPQTRNLTGLWWTAPEPGTGVAIDQAGSGQLFVAWFTYQPARATETGARPGMWLVMSSGKWISPTEYRGILYEARGTPANKPFSAAHGSLLPYGFATLRVQSPERIDFSATADIGNTPVTGTIPVIEVTKPLQRFLF